MKSRFAVLALLGILVLVAVSLLAWPAPVRGCDPATDPNCAGPLPTVEPTPTPGCPTPTPTPPCPGACVMDPGK